MRPTPESPARVPAPASPERVPERVPLLRSPATADSMTAKLFSSLAPTAAGQVPASPADTGSDAAGHARSELPAAVPSGQSVPGRNGSGPRVPALGRKSPSAPVPGRSAPRSAGRTPHPDIEDRDPRPRGPRLAEASEQPRKHVGVRVARVNVYLREPDLSVLDRVSTETQDATGEVVSRSDLLRALVEGLGDSGVGAELATCGTHRERVAFLANRLRR